MMKIDANILRANNIINDEIIPIIREYSQTTETIGDSVEFWKRLFESLANVIIDTKDDLSATTATAREPREPTTQRQPPPPLVTPLDDPSISFNSIEGHTGAAPIYRKRTPLPTKPLSAEQPTKQLDTDTLESQPKLNLLSERYLDQHLPHSTKKPTLDLSSSPNRLSRRPPPPSLPTRATPRRPQRKPPASQVGSLAPVSLAPAGPEAYELGFRAGYRAGLSPLRSPQFDVLLTMSPPRPRLSEYSQSVMDRRPPPDDSSSLLVPPQLETEIVGQTTIQHGLADSLPLPSLAGLPPTSPASDHPTRKSSLLPLARLRESLLSNPAINRTVNSTINPMVGSTVNPTANPMTSHVDNSASSVPSKGASAGSNNDNDDDDEQLPFVKLTPNLRYSPTRSKTMVFSSQVTNPAVTPRATKTSPVRQMGSSRRMGYYMTAGRPLPLPPKPLLLSPRRLSPMRAGLTQRGSVRLSPQKSVRLSIGSPHRRLRFSNAPSSPAPAITIDPPRATKMTLQALALAAAPPPETSTTTEAPSQRVQQAQRAEQPPPVAEEDDEQLKERLGPELYARFMAIRRG